LKKANQILKVNGILARLKNTVPKQILKTIYHSLIHPHLSYAITSWGNSNNKELKRLEILQKRAIRNINRARYNSHTNKLFKDLNILKLNDIFIFSCVKFYQRAKLYLVPQYFQQLLVQNTQLHPYFTRNNENLHINNTHSMFSKQLINVKISSAWNSLPAHIKALSTSQQNFNQRVKIHLISLYPQICNINNCFSCLNQ